MTTNTDKLLTFPAPVRECPPMPVCATPTKSVTIRLERSGVYVRAYPVCPNALLLAKLASVECFNKDKIDLIKQLGYNITVKQETLSLQDL